MGKQVRKLVLSLAVLVCIGAWAGVVATFQTTDDIATKTIALTIAALATEGLIWALAIIGGWSMFANRKALFARLFGRKKATKEA
ncbi:hypothetical protein [Maricaulis sp.]|uniref:hypothetical protein n=1 Tax=Maricaulis sp. TaxID=1486257 RepID=UPI002616F966|nr:hypothetical protein [Maricaulis sp.]